MAFTSSFPKKFFLVFIAVIFGTFAFGSIYAKANNAAASIPFSQNWTNVNLIVTNDDWSGAPSIIGYRGDGLTAAAGIDPQTILAANDSAPVIDVIANQSAVGLTTGGVAEFDGIVNSVIALQGSITARAPYIKIFLDTSNVNQIQLSYDIRDIDSSTDNAVQQVALHYRVGSSGDFINIPSGYVADATTGPSLATLVTPVSVTLPAAANGQPLVELRVMTTDAIGSDEWVGIDNISVAANYAPTGIVLAPNSVLENQPSGTTIGTLTAADPNLGDTHVFALVNSILCAGGGADNFYFSVNVNALETSAAFDYETKPAYFICAQTTDNYGLFKISEIQIDILDVPDETPPSVIGSTPASGSVLLSAPAQIVVQFSEDVKQDFSASAANSPINFMLVAAGAHQTFETLSCALGAAPTDTQIVVNASNYQNGGGSYFSTLTFNGGAALSIGKYLLFVCGTTSIEDLSGNKLNGGATDAQIAFTVSPAPANLPATGFPVGHMTQLPDQPAEKNYAEFSNLWLEIPALKVSASIVGVPFAESGWDVTWLGKNAGWLNETAFPTWAGNSVITAHVWDAYNQPGPFYKLKNLRYGDFVKVHAFGQIYVYEVRETKRIAPNRLSSVLKHEEQTWLTLVTCEDYQTLFQTYAYRRMVRAVWVSVAPEK